jgi:F-type H+-transporting ATPase subunit a
VPWKLPNIAVPVDTIFSIGGFPVTNTLLVTWLTIILLLGLFFAAIRKPKIVPGFIQNLVEWATELMLNLCEEVAGKENGRRFFPWVATIFFFVLFSNWWEVIPGIETVGKVGSDAPSCQHALHPILGIFLLGTDSNCITPWLRPPSTDLNLTVAIAVVSVIATQIYGFKQLGAFSHITKYLNYREGPMGILVGILEAILELARIISFSFRLFGNLFAGDVLLLVMSFLIPVAGPIVFYFLEVFVGFIQAFVFAMLTLVFMSLAVTPHEHHDAHAAVDQHEPATAAIEPAPVV